MLDIKNIRLNTEEIKAALLKRNNGEYDIDGIVELDKNRREILQEVEQLKAKQNLVSKEIPKLKKEGKDVTSIFEEMKLLSNEIKEMDVKVKEIDETIKNKILYIPNIPNKDVPAGSDDTDNIEMRTWGTPREFDFEIKPHWDLGVDLGILDFERASKITGARFTIFKGIGALLERTLINFMLTKHIVEHGYTELMTPLMVNRDSMTGTGQLPKFEDDAFKLPSKDFFMVPTAEVPVTNYHRDEILSEENLPIAYTAYTPCFRQEAGSAGRDTRGLIRNHQFDKVEMVKLVHPDNSYAELEKLTDDAEEILRALKLPYRVVTLCSGDLGFSAAKTYDIEVWMPSYGRYVEISSCSNFEDYQGRRANIRFRSEDKKLQFVHTLNGSGLAVGRTFAAIIENYQREDGSIELPEILQPLMGGLKEIR